MSVEGGSVRPQQAIVNHLPPSPVHPKHQATDAGGPLHPTMSDLVKFKLHRLEERLAGVDMPQLAEALAWYRAKLGLDAVSPAQGALASPRLGRARSNSSPPSPSRPLSGGFARLQPQHAVLGPVPEHTL